ncbi:MAG: hypothetical protein FWF71_01185 [Actinomycetia bacterium]|nr:hypothetical protein [Actinomycetes bacterium]
MTRLGSRGRLAAVLLVSLFLVLGGCSAGGQGSSGQSDGQGAALADAGNMNDAVNGNPFSSGNLDNTAVVEASGQYWPTERHIVYQGSPIEISYEFENWGPAYDRGLLVFIEGILQSYRTSDDPSNSYIHEFHMEENERLTITLIIDPTVGSKGDKLYLWAVMMLSPSYQPDPAGVVVFGHKLGCDEGSQSLIDYQADSKLAAKRPYGNAYFENITQAMRTERHDWDPSFDTAQLSLEGFDGTTDKVAVGDEFRCTATAVGGPDADYRLYLFCDLKPYTFSGGAQCAELPLRNGKATNVDFTLDTSKLGTGEAMVVFALAVPTTAAGLDDYTSGAIQSDRYLLVRE